MDMVTLVTALKGEKYSLNRVHVNCETIELNSLHMNQAFYKTYVTFSIVQSTYCPLAYAYNPYQKMNF